MNNEQFRRLLLDSSSSASKKSPTDGAKEAGSRSRSTALGSRQRSSIPMTPRSTQVDFAKQLAEYRGSRPTSKKPTAPTAHSPIEDTEKGPSKQVDSSEKRDPSLEERVKALEEAKNLGQIDEATFKYLLSALGVGGDTSSTHLVKGLDWELLKRARAGEDVTSKPSKPQSVAAQPAPEAELDPDAEFDKLVNEKEKEEIVPVTREERIKKGVLASPPPPSPPRQGGKMSRDEILRRLKESRAAKGPVATSPPPESVLGTKFKKISAKEDKKRWVEQDKNGRRREVLLVTGPDGKTKRKVRWLDKEGDTQKQKVPGLLEIDRNAKPLGMDVPHEALERAKAAAAAAAANQEKEDDDIFAGAGRDYNPLAGLEDNDDSSSAEDSEGEVSPVKKLKETTKEGETPKEEPQAAKPRNYFGEAATQEPEEQDRSNPLLKDPTFLAAVKKAAAIRRSEEDANLDIDEGDDEEAIARRRKFLEEARRREQLDSMDLDMGFGGSRFDDDDEDELPLEEEKPGNKRKRGGKKKKGDKHSADDVLKVLEGRKPSAKK